MCDGDYQQLIKSWVKVFVAGSVACYLAGVRDPMMLVDAGLAAFLPVLYTWLDPADSRFGRGK
jgi:hypothetical protein